MTRRHQWWLVGALGLVVAAGLAVALTVFGDVLRPVGVGTPAPDFRATTIDGTPRTKTLADYAGQVVLVNIWATWCPPCREEMPSLEALHRRLGPRGLRIVAVSIDDPGTVDQIRAFRDALGLTFEILHDADGRIRRDYQTTGVPETFVIGPDGVIRKKVIAAANWDSPANRAVIGRLLAEANRS